jgi:hypothetical protein
MLEIGPAPTGHRRAGQDAIRLHAIGDATIRERLRQRDNGGVDRADGGVRRFCFRGLHRLRCVLEIWAIPRDEASAEKSRKANGRRAANALARARADCD